MASVRPRSQVWVLLGLLREALSPRYGGTGCPGENCIRSHMGRIGEKATGLSLPDSEELLGFPQWAAHGADLCPGHSSSQVTRYARGNEAERPRREVPCPPSQGLSCDRMDHVTSSSNEGRRLGSPSVDPKPASSISVTCPSPYYWTEQENLLAPLEGCSPHDSHTQPLVPG